MSGLPLTRRLDPRPAAVAEADPLGDAVNIPYEELARRVYELPRKDLTIELVGPAEFTQPARDLLESQGRKTAYGEPQGAPGRSRLWSPNAYLESQIGQLTPGLALDLGCGVGRDAVYLAALGWRVTAIDHLPDALERGKELEARYMDRSAVSWLRADLDTFTPAEPFDLAILFFVPNSDVLSRLLIHANPDSTILIETFTETHIQTFGKPKIQNIFTLDDAEGWTVVSDTEGWREERHTRRVRLKR